MNLRPLAAASLALISGCMSLVDSPERFGFRDALGVDETPRKAVEPLAIPVLDLPAAPRTPEEIHGWCAGLSSDDPAERDRCESALRSAGEPAIPCLEDARRGEDREASARASALIERAKFGDVAALRALLESHLGPQEPSVALLAGSLEPRMAERAAAVELLQSLESACRRGGLNAEPLEAAFLLELLLDTVSHSAIRERRHRLHDAGYDEWRDPVATASLARIVRAGLRSPDGEIRHAAVGAAEPLGVGWEAALFPDLIAAGSEEALAVVASAARRGAADTGPARIVTLPGPPCDSSNVAAALLPFASALMSIAEDRSRSAESRAAALEAAAFSGDPTLAARIEAIWRRSDILALAAFHAMAVVGAPGSDPAIVEVIDGDLREISREEALGAAAASRTRAAIPKLERWKDDRGLACAAIGAIADPKDAEELIRLLGERETVEELRPIMGALVRLSPLPPPQDSRARLAIRNRLDSPLPDIRFLASCALSALDAAAGIAAWGGQLRDDETVNVNWPGYQTGRPLKDYAMGGLGQLTGIEIEGTHKKRLKKWREWWEEHRTEYEPK